MNKNEPAPEDLEYIKNMCEVSERIGFDWVGAIRLFPAATGQEVLWKEKMLAGIRFCGKLNDKRDTS